MNSANLQKPEFRDSQFHRRSEFLYNMLPELKEKGIDFNADLKNDLMCATSNLVGYVHNCLMKHPQEINVIIEAFIENFKGQKDWSEKRKKESIKFAKRLIKITKMRGQEKIITDTEGEL